MNTLSEAALRALDPKALERPLLKAVIEHQARLDSNLAAQHEDEAIAAEIRKELKPIFLGALACNVAVWTAIGWFLPGLFEPLQVLALAVCTSVAVVFFERYLIESIR